MACGSQVHGVLEFLYVALNCRITRSRHVHLPETLFQIVQDRPQRARRRVDSDGGLRRRSLGCRTKRQPATIYIFQPTSGIKFLLGSIDFY